MMSYINILLTVAEDCLVGAVRVSRSRHPQSHTQLSTLCPQRQHAHYSRRCPRDTVPRARLDSRLPLRSSSTQLIPCHDRLLTHKLIAAAGRAEASLKALLQLRESREAAEKEQREIDESVNRRSAQEEVGVKELLRAPNFWPLAVAMGLMVAQQTTGITAVVFFASTILEVGGEALAAKASVLLGVINLLGNVIGIYCIGTCKRRDCLLWSTYGLLTSLLVLATFFWAREAGGAALELANSLYLVPVVALLAYMVSFALGWGPVPWVFLGEGMPSQVRGQAAALVVSANWTFAFVVTKTFRWSLDSLGSANTFLSYAVMTAAAVLILRPYMPETFKKSTAEMDRLYLEEAAKKQQ
ncbi:Facilitated trehalose transporter Tret1 [Portunus trituberculatus]|uniref:Facilitated trehalose transporter Tret1 n=1 Tax=Portunus trituberculatus TaxID=210409 RepID=A0A5B7DZ08_PORTR|nr:Facilitated trehalose transporter Tret1 [Portunus trituberculatus]